MVSLSPEAYTQPILLGTKPFPADVQANVLLFPVLVVKTQLLAISIPLIHTIATGGDLYQIVGVEKNIVDTLLLSFWSIIKKDMPIKVIG